MKKTEPIELQEIARDILAYLLENPDARDTLEGIAEWWLLDMQVYRELRSVERALDQLVEANLIEARRAADGSLHYRVDKSRLDDISSVLSGGRRDG